MTVGLLHHGGDLLVGAFTLHGWTGVDENFLGIGCDGVDRLEVHRGFTPPIRRLAADDLWGELRQVEGRRKQVEIGLVETVEREHDDRDALACVAAVTQRLNVVGAQ